MSYAAGAGRWLAIGIAIAAVIDPPVPVPGYQQPVIRVAAGAREDASAVASAIAAAGFRTDPAETPAATILVAGRVPADLTPAPHTWIFGGDPVTPSVHVVDVATPSARLPGQAIDVTVDLRANGVRGTAEVTLEDAGLPVAAATHEWTEDGPWRARLQYLPPYTGAGRLRVRVAPSVGQRRPDDRVTDVFVPAARRPLRVLVVDAGVTWPAVFIRRALEGESAFSVSSTQRAAKTVVTRGGHPPAALSRDSLAPYEAAIVGGPGNLRASDLAALQWFVEERGGVVLFVPDDRPSGDYLRLAGGPTFDMTTLEEPVRLDGGLLASELAVPRSLPPASTVLAADPQRRPVVFVARRGAGAVILSGALDAWRHRAADDEAFARFWRQTIAAIATAVPPAMDVSVSPAIARPGEPVRVSVRIRDTELSPNADRAAVTLEARAVNPHSREDVPIRLWPATEPGGFSGDWRAPRDGAYNITASAGSLRGDATMLAAADVETHPDLAASLDLYTRLSGGRLLSAGRLDDMIDALHASYPAVWLVRRIHPMRSPWWVVPFAGLLCLEWALRRKRGLP